jgi:metal-responsive CopG/Arc/MetJ family transcriptional regulator
MANVKTAISLQESLFEQAESMAREMSISRSRLFTLALEEFIRRYHNRRLLEQINAAHEGEPDPEEEAALRAMRRKHRKVVEQEAW